MADPVLHAFRQYSSVPVVSMESAREHPCQGLADLLTVREAFGKTKGLPVALTWAPHIKPLPKAVPHSFVLTAAACGCDVRIAHPPGFELSAAVLREAEAYAAQAGGRVQISHDQSAALAGARAVYAKAWGPATTASASLADAAKRVSRLPEWLLTRAKTERAERDFIFLHCLPVRRNVEVADEVLDAASSRVVDQAENRFHVQRVIMQWVLE
jgi:N-acetylornithine carbamoyltransferase